MGHSRGSQRNRTQEDKVREKSKAEKGLHPPPPRDSPYCRRHYRWRNLGDCCRRIWIYARRELRLASVSGIVNECIDIINGGNERVILAGDFNLWPEHLIPIAEENLGLVDLWSEVEGLPVLDVAVGGSRIWTHKNGNSPNAARQELDFIFATIELADEVVFVSGGIDDFPDAWNMSDHAPVAVDFDY